MVSAAPRESVHELSVLCKNRANAWRVLEPTTQTRLRPSNSQYYHAFESLPTA
jgi:hypothetical protein